MTFSLEEEEMIAGLLIQRSIIISQSKITISFYIISNTTNNEKNNRYRGNTFDMVTPLIEQTFISDED